MMIRVVIVDDQKTVREYLDTYLSEIHEISVVGLATNGREAIAVVEECLPDVVLMDIEMPLMDGIEATKKISKHFNHPKILLLTSKEDKQLLDCALQAGAKGYILKTANSKDLDKIIHLTNRGYFQFGPTFKHRNYNESGVSVSEIYQTSNKSSSLITHNIDRAVLNIVEHISQIETDMEIQLDEIYKLSSSHSSIKQIDKPSLFPINLSGFRLNIDCNFIQKLKNLKQDELFVLGFILGVILNAILIALLSIAI